MKDENYAKILLEANEGIDFIKIFLKYFYVAFISSLKLAETYLGASQTSTMELFRENR